MNLNVYNWMIDTDFFWSALKALGAILIIIGLLLLYVYLKVRQDDSGENDDVFDIPDDCSPPEKISSGSNIRKL